MGGGGGGGTDRKLSEFYPSRHLFRMIIYLWNFCANWVQELYVTPQISVNCKCETFEEKNLFCISWRIIKNTPPFLEFFKKYFARQMAAENPLKNRKNKVKFSLLISNPNTKDYNQFVIHDYYNRRKVMKQDTIVPFKRYLIIEDKSSPAHKQWRSFTWLLIFKIKFSSEPPTRWLTGSAEMTPVIGSARGVRGEVTLTIELVD